MGPVESRRGPFVGRRRELDVLLDGLKRAEAGHGGVVLISGEPGIGKTRLVSELAANARDEGWQVFVGRAYDSEGMPPYLPFIEAVRDHVRRAPVDELRSQLGDGAPEVALLVREVRARLGGVPSSATPGAEGERFRLFESTVDFLLNVASSPRQRGLLLVLEDLHWADKPSLLLLQHLARRLATSRVSVVVTYRSVEIDRTHPLADALAELRRERLADHLLLTPLTADAVATFLAGLVGAGVAPGLVAEIVRETEGNPFFLEEVVRDLEAEGRYLTTLGALPADRDVPESVRQVIGKRLSRLSPEANRVLQVAAAFGDELTFITLKAISRSDDTTLVDALDEALRAGFLRERGDGYDLTHALVREVLYRDLSGPRRALIHRQIGKAIERLHDGNLDSHLSELAHHLLEGAMVGDAREAITYARRAGDRARRVFAYEEAIRFYQRALALDDALRVVDPEQHGELLLALGDAQRKVGDLFLALETFERAVAFARERGFPDQLARAAVGYEDATLPTGLSRAVHDDPSIRFQEEALRLLGDTESVLRVQVVAGLARAYYFLGAIDRAASLSAEAVAIARRLNDPRALAYALSARRYVLWGPDDVEERLSVVAELMRLAEEVDDRELALEGCEWLIRGSFEIGEMHMADEAIAVYARLAEEVREPRYRSLLATWRSIRALLAGRFAEAERHASESLAIGERIHSKNALLHYVAQMLALRRDQGRLADLALLEGTLQELIAQYPTYHSWRAVQAMVHATFGRRAEAARDFQLYMAAGFADLPKDWLHVPRLMFLASVCGYLGDAERAAILYERLLPYARHYNTEAGCLGAAARCLGFLATTLGRWEEAEAHFEEALALNERIFARPCVAHTLDAYAAMLLQRQNDGDRQRARALLERARGLYAELDMAFDLARVEDRLADLSGVKCPPSGAPFPNGLTAREVEVLRLIAAGRSNREIADVLVLSVRTVERHITNLYGKIGARGKADATAYALQHDLASLP